MKNIYKFDIKTLFILVLIIVIVLMRSCGGKSPNVNVETVYIKGKPYEVIKHVRDTQYVPKDTIIYRKGKDIYHDTTIYVTVPKNVDTTQILKDYFSKNVYNDTLKLKDNLGVVYLIDTISKNKILGRQFTAKVKSMTITDTLIVKETPKRQLYFGINSSFTKQDILNSVGTGFIYKDKKDKIFTFGAGVQQSQSNMLVPYLQGGTYWKIKLKK